jgi:hypothetical protein
MPDDGLPVVKWAKFGKRTRIDSVLNEHMTRYVYRYCTIAEALGLLLRGEWSFLKPDSWEDAYEGHLSRTLFGDGGPFKNSATYLKCVSFEYYSHAMWRIYGTSGGLVRLGMRLDKLLECLEACVEPRGCKVYVGRVRYVRPDVFRSEIQKLVDKPPKSTTSASYRRPKPRERITMRWQEPMPP